MNWVAIAVIYLFFNGAGSTVLYCSVKAFLENAEAFQYDPNNDKCLVIHRKPVNEAKPPAYRWFMANNNLTYFQANINSTADLFELFSSEETNRTMVGHPTRTLDPSEVYKSPIQDYWPDVKIEKVIFRFLNKGFKDDVRLEFDGRNSENSTDWFSSERLMKSFPWKTFDIGFGFKVVRGWLFPILPLAAGCNKIQIVCGVMTGNICNGDTNQFVHLNEGVKMKDYPTGLASGKFSEYMRIELVLSNPVYMSP